MNRVNILLGLILTGSTCFAKTNDNVNTTSQLALVSYSVDASNIPNTLTPATAPSNKKELLKELNLRLKNNPADEETYFERAQLKLKLNDAAGSIKDLNHLIKLSPNVANYYQLRGEAKLVKEDFLGALLDFNVLVNTNPSAEAYTLRAKSKAFLGDVQGAIIDNTQAIELDKANYIAYFNRAMENFYLEKYSLAVTDLNQVLTLTTSNAEEVYYNLGLAKYLLGDKKGAMVDLVKAEEMGYTEALATIKALKK
ncbi:tetratricopeptide repeat protein [Adhaeribacter aquaticus]|uniref:tetratricopeptide repeat protein n=1 Tax=Adhaeribacter aquaticus TaxID=299567 RepID=UPI0004077D26|nr:hypothetical protein [Adhaeribacter aquaticus]